jgi:hypothetical protein
MNLAERPELVLSVGVMRPLGYERCPSYSKEIRRVQLLIRVEDVHRGWAP